MKRFNTGPLDKNKYKINLFSENERLFKCNKTIQAYINSKLNNLNHPNNNNNKNNKQITKRKNPNPLLINTGLINQYTINSSTSTMLSDKSNNNKEYYSPSLSLNGEMLERDDFNNNIKIDKIEKIIEENENLKQQLKLSRNKINNLEEILEKMIKESLPLSKEECPKPTPEIRKFPIPKKTKCQRIINYSREKDGEKITKYVRAPEDKKKYEEFIIMKQFGN